MFLILKARSMSNLLGAKLMKFSKNSSIHRAKDDYLSPSPFLPDVCQEFTGVHQKRGANEIVCGFTVTFTKRLWPSAPVHLLE